MNDLSKFKVIYSNKVLNAVALLNLEYGENTQWDAIKKTPKFIEILVINEDGNMEVLRDEAWMFQFIPIISQK